MLATPKVEETKIQKRIEMKQIGKRANRACFTDEHREIEKEKSAHKMSQTYLKTAIKNCVSPRVKTARAANRQRNININSVDNINPASGMNSNRQSALSQAPKSREPSPQQLKQHIFEGMFTFENMVLDQNESNEKCRNGLKIR